MTISFRKPLDNIFPKQFNEDTNILPIFALQFGSEQKFEYDMAVTTLKRKARRNRQRQVTRVIKIKQLNAKPVIKNVDVEELKKEFSK
ncbi:hypothetical protein [Echinicola vietnamensis]|uniref:Uncharacterized protein n=3 Tax=Echinicola TaxID=390846 RepID=L0FXL9_ECHVK|nr:hypothetical protein [Echinicola vietnamensis]AGA78649.1 hypothetical protein Echvi_2401 [Echinicola vietnamensis DSM 17526]